MSAERSALALIRGRVYGERILVADEGTLGEDDAAVAIAEGGRVDLYDGEAVVGSTRTVQFVREWLSGDMSPELVRSIAWHASVRA